MKTYEFTVVLEREAEAIDLIRDAIRLHIEARLERGEPMYEEVKTSTIRVEV